MAVNGGMVDVAEPDRARGLAVPVAGAAEQVEGLCV